MPPSTLTRSRLAVIQVLPTCTSFPERKEPMFHLLVRSPFPQNEQLGRGFTQAFREVLQQTLPSLALMFSAPSQPTCLSQLPLGTVGAALACLP